MVHNETQITTTYQILMRFQHKIIDVELCEIMTKIWITVLMAVNYVNFIEKQKTKQMVFFTYLNSVMTKNYFLQQRF